MHRNSKRENPGGPLIARPSDHWRAAQGRLEVSVFVEPREEVSNTSTDVCENLLEWLSADTCELCSAQSGLKYIIFDTSRTSNPKAGAQRPNGHGGWLRATAKA